MRARERNDVLKPISLKIIVRPSRRSDKVSSYIYRIEMATYADIDRRRTIKVDAISYEKSSERHLYAMHSPRKHEIREYIYIYIHLHNYRFRACG